MAGFRVTIYCIMEQVLPPELVWESGMCMYTNFFPLALACEMAHAALTQPERKVLVDALGGEPFPEPFHTAAQFVVDNTPTNAINTLIIKRYEIDEPSSAFDFHYDPEEYNDYLVLCSLGSLATVTVIDMNVGQLRFQCRPNTALLLPAYGMPKFHKVSPPDIEHGVRPFAFFGHRSHDPEPAAA
jgi:hypothetical protein